MELLPCDLTFQFGRKFDFKVKRIRLKIMHDIAAYGSIFVPYTINSAAPVSTRKAAMMALNGVSTVASRLGKDPISKYIVSPRRRLGFEP